MHSYLSYMRHTAQRPWVTMGAGFVILVLIGSGHFASTQPSLKIILPLMGIFLSWLAWELYRGISQYWTAGRSFDRSYASYLGLGFALLAACGILLQLTGGLFSPFYPLMFLCVAFLASIGTSRQGSLWFGYAFILEVSAILATGPHQPGIFGLGVLHLLYIGLFAGSHHLYLHGMLRELSEKRNRKRATQVSLEVHATKVPPDSTGMTALSLASIDQDRQVLLSRLKEGLDAHGCALLWLDAEGEFFEVFGIETDAAQFDTGPFPARNGVPASLFKGESSLRLSRSGENKLQLPYYNHDVHPKAWLAIPIEQNGIVRGALCVDRIHPVPFSARDELLLEATSAILSRALESERALLHSSLELESLTQVANIGQILTEASSGTMLVEQILELAMHIVPFDWAFVSSIDLDEQTHKVLATTPEVAYLYQQTFQFEGTLLSLANKYKYAFPEKGLLRTSGPMIASEDPPLPVLTSLYILPLVQKDESIGCLVMASQDPQLFVDKEREKKLTIFAQQAASSLANAQYSEQVEHLTRRDSLTGLDNHSTLMEGLRKAFDTASDPSQMCLLMFNIDNFRHINHRYGYQTGDHVLQRLAKVLLDFSDANDIVARYSGEEFLMLCKGLEMRPGLKYIDSICHQIGQIEFCSSDENPEVFSITVSAGLSASPEHAIDPDALLHHTIEAMLQAKQRGGNQAVMYANEEDGIALATPNPDAQIAITPPNGWGWGSLPPLQDSQQLQDPKRWSLSSFTKEKNAEDADSSLFNPITPRPGTPPPNSELPQKALSEWSEKSEQASHPSEQEFPPSETT